MVVERVSKLSEKEEFKSENYIILNSRENMFFEFLQVDLVFLFER